MNASGINLKDGNPSVEKDSLCEELLNANVQLDVYKEIPFAVLGKFDSIESKGKRAAAPLPSLFIDSLRQIPFSVCILPYCEFFHVGTSRKLLQNLYTINYTAAVYEFQNFNKTKAIDKSGLSSAFVYNSLINTASIRAKGPVLIEGCYLQGRVQLDG